MRRDWSGEDIWGHTGVCTRCIITAEKYQKLVVTALVKGVRNAAKLKLGLKNKHGVVIAVTELFENYSLII